MGKVAVALVWDVRAHGQQAVVVGEPGQQQGAAPSTAWPVAEDGQCEMLSLLFHPTHAPGEPCPKPAAPAQDMAGGHGFEDPQEGAGS